LASSSSSSLQQQCTSSSLQLDSNTSQSFDELSHNSTSYNNDASNVVVMNSGCSGHNDMSSMQISFDETQVSEEGQSSHAAVQSKEFLNFLSILSHGQIQCQMPRVLLSAFSILNLAKTDTDAIIQETIIQQVSQLQTPDIFSTVLKNSNGECCYGGFGSLKLNATLPSFGCKVFRRPFSLSQLLEIELFKNKLNFKFALPCQIFLTKNKLYFTYKLCDITTTLQDFQTHFLNASVNVKKDSKLTLFVDPF